MNHMRDDVRKHIEAKIIVTQSEIIRLLKEALDEVFSILSQHLAAEEMNNLPCIEKINTAAKLKKDML